MLQEREGIEMGQAARKVTAKDTNEKLAHRRPRMPNDESRVGYKKPPAHSRFQKGQSGNPRGPPKKVADFMEDAAEILGGTVTGQAKGKSITLPMVQAMFRTMCRQALKGDNRALRRVIELMLTLEPAPETRQNARTRRTLRAAAKADCRSALSKLPSRGTRLDRQWNGQPPTLTADSLIRSRHRMLWSHQRALDLGTPGDFRAFLVENSLLWTDKDPC